MDNITQKFQAVIFVKVVVRRWENHDRFDYGKDIAILHVFL